MPLSFNSGLGGDWTPYVRYMASTASWATAEGAFQFKKAAFDLGRIQTGWCLLAEGQAPEWVMDESIEKTAPRPDGEGWKRGFKVNMLSRDMFGEESPVREWGTNATGATMAIQKLFTDWEEMKPTDNQVAIVEYAGATPTKVGKGNTNVPTLNILKLIDRPAELEDIGSAGADAGATSSPDTASASTEDDDEFI
jgi:hypothetical protein